jgi:hypothetical protein
VILLPENAELSEKIAEDAELSEKNAEFGAGSGWLSFAKTSSQRQMPHIGFI